MLPFVLSQMLVPLGRITQRTRKDQCHLERWSTPPKSDCNSINLERMRGPVVLHANKFGTLNLEQGNERNIPWCGNTYILMIGKHSCVKLGYHTHVPNLARMGRAEQASYNMRTHGSYHNISPLGLDSTGSLPCLPPDFFQAKAAIKLFDTFQEEEENIPHCHRGQLVLFFFFRIIILVTVSRLG